MERMICSVLRLHILVSQKNTISFLWLTIMKVRLLFFLDQKNIHSWEVQSKTRSKFRTLLPVLGIAAFLSLDTYLAYKFFKKDTSADTQGENIPTAQVQAPVIQKTPVQTSTVSEIIKKIIFPSMILFWIIHGYLSREVMLLSQFWIKKWYFHLM